MPATPSRFTVSGKERACSGFIATVLIIAFVLLVPTTTTTILITTTAAAATTTTPTTSILLLLLTPTNNEDTCNCYNYCVSCWHACYYYCELFGKVHVSVYLITSH